MNVGKLCNFLEKHNNTIFISDYEDSDRWSDDSTAVMFVNNSSHLIMVAQDGTITPIPWEQVRAELSKHIRKHSNGFVTLAAFETEPQQKLNIGSQWASSDITGTQPPLLTLVVSIATVVILSFIVYTTRHKDSKARLEN